MREPKTHCDTCACSYREQGDPRQRCRNPAYNAPSYTHDMLMEDWGQGYCRFWTPQTERTTL